MIEINREYYNEEFRILPKLLKNKYGIDISLIDVSFSTAEGVPLDLTIDISVLYAEANIGLDIDGNGVTASIKAIAGLAKGGGYIVLIDDVFGKRISGGVEGHFGAVGIEAEATVKPGSAEAKIGGDGIIGGTVKAKVETIDYDFDINEWELKN